MVKVIKKSLYLIVLTIMLLLSACSMNDLPNGKFVDTSISPKGDYFINTYLCSGNATTDFSIRCEVVESDTSQARNIYWCYHKDSAVIKWIDDETVEINNIVLNVIDDKYDWRVD